ncbi:MAG: glycosyltransferase family 39 protein [Bdellovibrionales bacterium]|nr:glycosyltransferase family 39 protein [Bdellovibrionales bacterium]
MNDVAPHTRNSCLLIAVLCSALSFLLLLPGLNAPFVTTGEPREAVVAQTMILEGDVLKSVRYDQDLATKPPLLHWGMVLAARAFGGLSEAATRLPSVVAASVALGFWAFFLLPIISRQKTLLTLAILFTAAEWYRHAALARVDMLLASCCTLSLVFLYWWMTQQRILYLVLATLPLALGALTKGPVGAALPLFMAFVALAYWRKLSWSRLFSMSICGAVSLLPLIVWYGSQYSTAGEASLSVAIHENLDRLLGTMSDGTDPHSHGPGYLVGVLLAGFLPWSLIFLALIPMFWKKASRSGLMGIDEEKELLQWCAIISIVCFGFFLIPSSKRSSYLLPMYPAVATLLSALFSRFTEIKLNAAKQIAKGFGIFVLVVWTLLLLVRLGPVDGEVIASLTKKPERILFYLNTFQLRSADLSLSFLLGNAFLLGAVGFLAFSSSLAPLFRFSAAFVALLVAVKWSYIMPAAEALTPRDFIAMELRDHAPTELSMETERMYAEVFYARRINPQLPVTEYRPGSQYVLRWSDDAPLLDTRVYSHISPTSIEKPEKRLEFVILSPVGDPKPEG